VLINREGVPNKRNLGYAELDVEARFRVEPLIGLGVGRSVDFDAPTGILKNYHPLNPDTPPKPGSVGAVEAR
jgi:hypothetical protein